MARKRKRGRPDPPQVIVVLVELVHTRDERMGVIAMNYTDNTSNEASEPEAEPESAVAPDDPPAAAIDESVHALDELERLHDRDREDFARMAAVQDLGPQLTEALRVILALSPQALEVLAAIARLPAEEKRLIRRAVSLPDEVKVALRGILDA